MGAAEHKLSRREVLAVACVAPVLPRHAGLDPASTFSAAAEKDRWTPDQVRGDATEKKWQRALARYTRAEAEIEALKHCEDDDVYDRAVGRQIARLGRLLTAPAPDLAAAARKLELIVRHAAYELRYGDAAFSVLLRDLRGLAAREN